MLCRFRGTCTITTNTSLALFTSIPPTFPTVWKKEWKNLLELSSATWLFGTVCTSCHTPSSQNTEALQATRSSRFNHYFLLISISSIASHGVTTKAKVMASRLLLIRNRTQTHTTKDLLWHPHCCLTKFSGMWRLRKEKINECHHGYKPIMWNWKISRTRRRSYVANGRERESRLYCQRASHTVWTSAFPTKVENPIPLPSSRIPSTGQI